MKNFYIFLDIDGVMYDWKYIINEIKSGRMQKGRLIRKFKPESVEALNLLIEELERQFNVGLVVSSTWRLNLPRTIDVLKENGVKYDKEIQRTPIIKHPVLRGKQILEYLSNKENYDFVIIDDEMFDFGKHFKQEKIIKCEMFNSALSLDKINAFLSNLDGFKKVDNFVKVCNDEMSNEM